MYLLELVAYQRLLSAFSLLHIVFVYRPCIVNNVFAAIHRCMTPRDLIGNLRCGPFRSSAGRLRPLQDDPRRLKQLITSASGAHR